LKHYLKSMTCRVKVLFRQQNQTLSALLGLSPSSATLRGKPQHA
jgi:hypothetical protein